MDLTVPFSEKDDAKRLGARWNPERRTWYVPLGVDPGSFARWLPNRTSEQPYRVFAREAYLVTASEQCWRCKQTFTAVALLLAPGFVLLDEQGAGQGQDRINDWAFAEYLTRLSPEIARSVQATQSAYRLGYSRTTDSHYWANHCPSCRALQGDFHLYSEPDGAFWLISAEDAGRMQAQPLPDDFFADADVILGQDQAPRILGVRSRGSQAERQPPSTRPSPPAQAGRVNVLLHLLHSMGRRSS